MKPGIKDGAASQVYLSGGLVNFLRYLPKEMRAEIRPALKSWSDNIARVARAKAPVRERRFAGQQFKRVIRKKAIAIRPGTLRDSIKASVQRDGLSAQAGIPKRLRTKAFYAHFVEGGTKPHKAGARFHPGAKAKPFLKPAAVMVGRAGASQTIDAIRKALHRAQSHNIGITGTLKSFNSQLSALLAEAKNVQAFATPTYTDSD